MAENMPMDFGNYVLQDLIARGGMAEIYRAKMRTGIDGFEKPVAIKKILPNLAENDEFITMLIDEARISVTMNHANIAQVYDLGRVGESYYIAMEYIPGVDLSSVIKKLGKDGYLLPLDHAIFITKELCAGLYYAHSKKDEKGNNLGVVHRDISPHNVLVSFSGNVKVIDFGVAKASVKLGQTRMGVIKGKLLYMAPEQAMAKQLDCRADIFSAGLCLYRMLTGHLPFEADSEFQIYNNVLTATITPPNQLNPEIPPDLNQVVMKSLERDVNQRYTDAWLMHQDLERVLHRVAPGYTMNRLSAFMNEYFADERPAPMGAEPRVTSPSYPSAPSVQSGRYEQADRAPNTPPNFQPAQVRQPVAAHHQVSVGGPTVPMSAAEIAAALPPLARNAPPHIPTPEELGFKPRNPSALEEQGELDADPTVDMQLDAEALQRMSQMARARPNNQRTQIDPKGPKAAAPAQAPASRLPLILGIVGAGLLLLLVVAAILIFALGVGQGDDPALMPPVTPSTAPPNAGQGATAQPTPPNAARAGSAPAALKAASLQVADAHRKVYEAHSATISLTVYTDPQGAAVYLKRDLLGESPLTVQIPRGEDPVELSLQLNGYEKTTTEIVPSTDRKANITLTERANAAPDKGEKGDKGAKTEKTPKGEKTGDKAGAKKNGELLDPW